MEDLNMTFEEWQEKYKPIMNPFTGSKDGYFETGGEEFEFVRKQDPLTIWTDGDGDEGGTYLWNGFRFVNRIGYYITEIPFSEGDFIQIMLSAPDEFDDDEYDNEDEVDEL